ncbi:MAG: hypothetical protein PHC62_00125 [Candidatus Izemoplasmatales bacterium]|nr:hypothetical protein [Candidatus Izemoplasmatales bacterium]
MYTEISDAIYKFFKGPVFTHSRSNHMPIEFIEYMESLYDIVVDGSCYHTFITETPTFKDPESMLMVYNSEAKTNPGIIFDYILYDGKPMKVLAIPKRMVADSSVFDTAKLIAMATIFGVISTNTDKHHIISGNITRNDLSQLLPAIFKYAPIFIYTDVVKRLIGTQLMTDEEIREAYVESFELFSITNKEPFLYNHYISQFYYTHDYIRTVDIEAVFKEVLKMWKNYENLTTDFIKYYLDFSMLRVHAVKNAKDIFIHFTSVKGYKDEFKSWVQTHLTKVEKEIIAKRVNELE